jgi:hypothetical protein
MKRKALYLRRTPLCLVHSVALDYVPPGAAGGLGEVETFSEGCGLSLLPWRNLRPFLVMETGPQASAEGLTGEGIA